MVRHIVCFKLKDNSPENCATTRDILLSMRGKVPTAQQINVFTDELHSARSFDLMLQVDVLSFATLDEYQNDPYHCNIVKKHMSAVAENTITLDFEL